MKRKLQLWKKRKNTIDVFALTLNTAWNNIKLFLDDKDYRNTDINLLMVDPKLEGLEDIHSGWKDEAERIYKDIEHYIVNKEENLQARKIQIRVKKYKYGPCIHGYCINEKYLYFSLCRWDSTYGLVGDPCQYEYFDNPNDPQQQPYFKWWNNWINKFSIRN
jgi:hypothetical protein